MHSLASDLRYAARELRRRPGFTLTAVLSLALGVGATSAVFSVIYAVLINPFPYAGADRMAQLSLKDKAGKYRYTGLTGAQLEQIVVADARNDGLRNPIKPAVYVPYTLRMRMFTQMLVRTRVAPLSVLRDVRAQLVQIDREQQVMRVRDLEGWITGMTEYAQQRVVATLFGIFSVLALLLAAAGLYSVVSYGVATRTNEFGIRMALGAKAGDVVRIVLAATSVNVGAGLAAGLVLNLIFDRVAAKWVAESSRDPVILGGVTVLLVTVAGLACLAPARRAASVDPMEALRYE